MLSLNFSGKVILLPAFSFTLVPSGNEKVDFCPAGFSLTYITTGITCSTVSLVCCTTIAATINKMAIAAALSKIGQ